MVNVLGSLWNALLNGKWVRQFIYFLNWDRKIQTLLLIMRSLLCTNQTWVRE